jgi:hypothetical protein
MKTLKALQNPFLLVAEGFIVGAILFFATTPGISQGPLGKLPQTIAATAQP